MRKIKYLTAALCAVVFLCGFTLPAYAGGVEEWADVEVSATEPVQTAEPEPDPTSAATPEPSPEPTATAAPTVTNTSAAPSTTAATTAPAVTLSADDTTEEVSSATGGVDWEGLDDAERNPLTPDGQGTVVDSADDTEGKEFFTITTADESVFYLIIDRQKNGDNVYFLNTVTVADLMALAEDSGEAGSAVTAEPEPEPTTSTEPEPEPGPEPEETGGSLGMFLVALAVVAVGGGAGWYFKIYRPRQQRAADDLEEDYPEPEYESGYDGIDDDGRDEDGPPWDEEDE